MNFLSPVLNLIGSLLLDEYARISGVSDKLEEWGEKLPMIQAVLDSAEEKQMNGDPATIQWLADLRDVAYDMEDLLDEFFVEAKRDASNVKALSRSTKLPFSLIACCSSLRPRTLISGHRMANEIKDVDRRLEQVLGTIPMLGLVQNSRSESHNDLPRFVTTSLPEPKFVGREKQMEELLARLTGSEATDDSIRPFIIVSIVGMGGLGKTTLAQELYDKARFAVKAWACVSDTFDEVAITKSILDQVAPSSSSTEKDLNQLQNSLKEKLSGKKFLIVLDDIWNDRYDQLHSLLKPLYSGSKGSRILLTTRNLEVARLAGDCYPKHLDFLSLGESLSLLAYHSIGEENFERHPHLRDVAVQLAKKCKGLPLSVKTIGGLLRFGSDDKKWKGVLTHGIWDREDGQGKIPPALKLSYAHLPVHLKRCFVSCALFPKDYLFDQDEAIRLWIIQGLLHKKRGETCREVGMKNLAQLEAVSLVQKAKDEKTRYSMHDLVNDLAKSIDVGSFFSSDEYKDGSIPRGEYLGKVRHATIVAQNSERFLSKRFDVYRAMKKLRTFMPFQITVDPEPNVHVSPEVIHDLIMGMKKLRMLSLRSFIVWEIPERIGELKLLRWVDFSHTKIEELPESICDLVELQSLLLRGCGRLMKLPRNIHKLTNLLHLDITGTHNLEEMPPYIGRLTNLEILSDFVVGKEAGQELKQLGPLKWLQRELHVRNLLAVDDIEDACNAGLSEKEAIIEISFDWGSISRTSRGDYHNQLKVLEQLRPPGKIESLAIHYYGAEKFPSGLYNPCSMNNVITITLTGCRSVDSLPPFGQLPLLERLDIHCLDAVSSVGTKFYGSKGPFFRSLRSLSFEDMGAWEEWSSHGDNESDQPFPCLRQLKVKKCPKLNGGCTIPLPSLVEIDIDGCGEGLMKCLVDLTSLTKMAIRNVPQLVHIEGSLSTSWVALEEMTIVNCPRFKSFKDGEGMEQVPPKLKKLEIRDCEDLEMVPNDLSRLTSLEEMKLISCQKLCSLPNGGLPPSLRSAVVDCCRSLPQSHLISSTLPESLEKLFLWNLEGLISITDLAAEVTSLSRSLRNLHIRGCRSLTTLPDSLAHLSALSMLCLVDCPALEMERFPDLPYNLSILVVAKCPKVKSLPRDMHHLTSLKTLCIDDCEGITSLPRGGFPPNLERLTIEGCRGMNQPIGEWGVRGLTALRELIVRGGMECVDEMECFPPDGDWVRLLPPSLFRLSIGCMEKLERVDCGLKAHLTSLQFMEIYSCPRLRRLPDDGLPDSLTELFISGCPQLEETCSMPKGEYWPHLRLIPEIDIIFSSDFLTYKKLW